jgi:hypothetical protein
MLKHRDNWKRKAIQNWGTEKSWKPKVGIRVRLLFRISVVTLDTLKFLAPLLGLCRQMQGCYSFLKILSTIGRYTVEDTDT